jgi:hypothetical protein
MLFFAGSRKKIPRRRRGLSLLMSAALLALTGAGNLSAQRWEFGATSGLNRTSRNALGSVQLNDPAGEDSRLIGNRGSGVRFTMNTPGYYGHEVSYLFSNPLFRATVPGTPAREQIEDRVQAHQGAYNFLIYFMPSHRRWRPFITGGAQAHRYGAPDVPGWIGGSSFKYGANWGGGLKLRPVRNLLLRMDGRQYITGSPYDLSFSQAGVMAGFPSAGLFRHLELSVGVSLAF